MGYGADASRVERAWGGPSINAHRLHNLAARRIGAALIVVAAVAIPALVATPASAADERYRVRPGDTLSEIGERLGVSTGALVETNGLQSPHRVLSGSVLRVPRSRGGNGGDGAAPAAPSARTHHVRPGEHLTGIARRYGVSVGALAAANGLDDADLVVVGRRLAIPAGGGGTSGTSSGLPARLTAKPERLALMSTFDRWAAHYDVPADLLKAMTYLESGWQNRVTSSTGAVGIGQLMPTTVSFMEELIGEDLDPRDPDDNIRMSARYLRFLLGTRGSASAALAAYYQGPGSVDRRGIYPETLRYVADVLALRARF